jgi:hypothetical protein
MMWTVPVSLCASASASVGAASGPPLDPLELLESPAPESPVPDAPDDVPDPELEFDASVEPDAPELEVEPPSRGEGVDDEEEHPPAMAAPVIIVR